MSMYGDSPILYRGSVKDIKGPILWNNKNSILFQFSNRYSVFDWGEMPDELLGKGAALAHLAFAFFKYLENPLSWQKNEHIIKEKLALNSQRGTVLLSTLQKLQTEGLTHHCLAFVAPNAFLASTLNILRPSFKGNYDYSIYKKYPTQSLVPLEIVFRFSLAPHSSILKRSTPQYLHSLGLPQDILTGDEKFQIPIIEFFTKLESTDRPLTYEEAQECAGLRSDEFENLLSLNILVALQLQSLFFECDIELVDGKLEWGFGNFVDNKNMRSFLLADSIGPDEMRLKYQGRELSKETLREKYRGCDWYQNVNKAKKLAELRKSDNWKQICREEFHSFPPSLPKEEVDSVAHLYQFLATVIWKKVFNEDNILVKNEEL